MDTQESLPPGQEGGGTPHSGLPQGAPDYRAIRLSAFLSQQPRYPRRYSYLPYQAAASTTQTTVPLAPSVREVVVVGAWY